jgi:acetate kinase
MFQVKRAPMSELILVLNCGSSSIKFALFESGAEGVPRLPLWKGKVDEINGAAPRFEETGVAPSALTLEGTDRFHAALQQIRSRVLARLQGRRMAAVVHRVVHGGVKYMQPVRVDAAIVADLRSYIPLAPLHQPFALEAIEALLASNPGLVQVACFDTSFHQTMPVVERMLPLPHDAWDRGLRRYGFHGLSYEYMSIRLPECHGPAASGRVIVAHLGSGASLCAMQGLQSVATTMGFSALDGLMMGTRCGSLDPGALLYLMEVDKLTLEQVGRLLYHEAGLRGVSGVSSDPRELLEKEAGDSRVQAALALYVRRIVREIGALTAVLGGLDMLVFTAGIGEHNAVIRERICNALGFLGVVVDAEANRAHRATISHESSRLQVVVESTNEEWVAARHAARVMTGPPAA